MLIPGNSHSSNIDSYPFFLLSSSATPIRLILDHFTLSYASINVSYFLCLSGLHYGCFVVVVLNGVDQKVCSGFSARCYRKTQTNFLANPINIYLFYLFIWLCWVLVVAHRTFVATCGIF